MSQRPRGVGEQHPPVDASEALEADLAAVGVDFILSGQGHPVHAADTVGPREVSEDGALRVRGGRGQICDPDGVAEQARRAERNALDGKRALAVGGAGERGGVVRVE